MNKFLRSLFFIVSLNWSFFSIAQITLSHNVGTTPIKTDITTCEYEEYWARTFTLADFGITNNEQFIIHSGEVAISNSNENTGLLFNFYSIDSNFPNSEPERISYGNQTLTPYIGDTPEIVQIIFNTPIVIPAGIERILVEVTQTDVYNPDFKKVLIAGTEYDNDISWFKGCNEPFPYRPTENLSNPVLDANFFINVTGEKFSISNSGSTTRLTHNICDDIIKTMNHSCSSAYTFFARDFYLDDFGISTNEEFIINAGQVGISYSTWGATVQFNIYEIDDDFPDSFSEENLIGSSQEFQFPYMSNIIRVLDIDFEVPVLVPAHVKRILVEVKKGVAYGSALAHFAGTVQDDGAPTWYKGCIAGLDYVNTNDLNYQNSTYPPSDYNVYINVTGNVNHTTNNFEMNISNICSEFLKEFSVEPKEDIASISWNFGDPASGANNFSTDSSPYHDFSEDGTYTITANVTATNGNAEVITETIRVKEPPYAYGIDNLESCEDTIGSGFSTSFDTSNILSQVLGNQTEKTVTFIDGNGNEYDYLPNPFSNSIKDRETITVRVARNDELCCFSEISFDLIVNPLPDFLNIEELAKCDDNDDGFSVFDLSNLPVDLVNGQPDLTVQLFDSNNNIIPISNYNNFANLVPNQDYIKAVITNPTTTPSCSSEIVIDLILNSNPEAYQLQILYGCDDNNDGISEYFDVSNVENQVLNGQTGMVVSYFDQNGNQLPSPLPNPFTNSNPFNESITVRVTDMNSTCYAETTLQLQTVTQPNINQPNNIYACDQGNGFTEFDTSSIEQQIVGNQTGLIIHYYDSNNNLLPSPLPISFQNTQPFFQTINVKVEDASNPICYSETSFELIVNDLPEINLEEEYFICNLEPSITLMVNSNLYTYEWYFEDGTLISTTQLAEIVNEGNYNLSVTQLENGVVCEDTFEFRLIRSVLPEIQEVNYGELGDNFIEVIASGDGDFEYSIDGINYQNHNYFSNIQGGIYTVYVRDKEGCGEDSKEVTIIDYPKFFTPNNDGHNDYWQIRGISKFPNSTIFIYDRYGKLLKQLSPNSSGWDGTFNGRKLSTNDYWFSVNLENGSTFSGHFSLKR